MIKLSDKAELIPCDLCGSLEQRLLLTTKDYHYGFPGIYSYVECQRCRAIYLNPRPTKQEIGTFYPDLNYHGFRIPTGINAALQERVIRSNAKSLLEGLPPRPRVLEIGCGAGQLLATLHHMGAEVLGVEPNAAAAELARSRGLTIKTGRLEDVEFGRDQFDLVFMKYALEHVHSPLGVLTIIRELLKDNGRAVFWLPNARSWEYCLFGKYWRALDAPRHLHIFTPDSLARLAQAACMRVNKIEHSPVSNEWVGSVEFFLKDHGAPEWLSRFLGVSNPLMLALWAPISMLAAAFGRAGRIRVEIANEHKSSSQVQSR